MASCNRACFVSRTVLQDKTCKISGSCSIKSWRQRYSLYKPQNSAINPGKNPTFGGASPRSCRNFRHLKGAEYCTALVHRHAPTKAVLTFEMALLRPLQATSRFPHQASRGEGDVGLPKCLFDLETAPSIRSPPLRQTHCKYRILDHSRQAPSPQVLQSA